MIIENSTNSQNNSDVLKKVENFLKQGWKPEEITLSHYLNISSQIQNALEELQVAEINSSTEEYESKKNQILTRLNYLLR